MSCGLPPEKRGGERDRRQEAFNAGFAGLQFLLLFISLWHLEGCAFTYAYVCFFNHSSWVVMNLWWP